MCQVFEGTKAHYLPLITCLNYLLARPQRGAHGKATPGLNAAQRGQVLLAMRLSQLRNLTNELQLVRGREEMVAWPQFDPCAWTLNFLSPQA